MMKNALCWTFFELRSVEQDGKRTRRAVCMFKENDDDKECGIHLAAAADGSTSGMMRHLEAKHPDWKSRAKKRKLSLGSTVWANHQTQSARQRRRDALLMLTKLFVQNNFSFLVCERESFRNLCKSIRYLGKPPSRQLMRALVQNCSVVARDNVRQELRMIRGMTLCADIWRARDMRSFLGVIAVFIDDAWRLQSRLLGFEDLTDVKHDANQLRLALSNLCAKNDIDPEQQITAFVSDSGSNIVKAAQMWRQQETGSMLARSYLSTDEPLVAFPCVAHLLHLAVRKALRSIEFVINKVREINVRFRKSQVWHRLLVDAFAHEGKTPLRPISEVVTRWHSTCNMLERFLELVPFMSTAVKAGLRTRAAEAEALQSALHVLSDEALMCQIARIAEILQTIRKYAKAVEEDCAGSLASVLVCYWQLVQVHLLHQEHDLPIIKNFKTCMSHAIQNYILRHDLCATAVVCLLSPQFINPNAAFGCDKEPLKGFWEWLRGCSTIPPIEDQVAGYCQHACLRCCKYATLPYGLTENAVRSFDSPPSGDSSHNVGSLAKSGLPIIRRRKAFKDYVQQELQQYVDLAEEEPLPPLEFWKKFAARMPLLAMLAKSFLAIPASSSAPERLFSLSGWMHHSRRTSLSSDSLNDLLTLQYYWFRSLPDQEEQVAPENCECEDDLGVQQTVPTCFTGSEEDQVGDDTEADECESNVPWNEDDKADIDALCQQLKKL